MTSDRSAFRRFARLWLPHELDHDAEQGRQARLVSGVIAVACVGCLILGPAYWLMMPEPYGAPMAWLILAGIPVYFLTLPLQRVTRSPFIASCEATFCGTVHLTALSWFTGGILSPAVSWLVLMPCITLLIAGRLSGIVYLGVVLAVQMSLLVRYPTAQVMPQEVADIFWFPCTLGLISTALAIFFLYERTKEDAVARLRAANAELARAQSEAQAADRSKGAFLSRMSHAIRTPLMAILGFTDLLADEVAARPGRDGHERAQGDEPADAVGGDPAEARDALATLRRNGEHLLHVIDDLLDLSRIESGGLEIQREPVDLGVLIDDVLGLVRVSAEQRGIALRLDTPAALPRRLESDPTRLRQILLNLVSNAIKFTERGSVTLRVEPEVDRLVFAVRDTGIGMTAEQVERLFRPFGQATRETSRRFGGSGLGLLISKRLIEALGGSIQVASTAGVGSTFTFELPRIEVAEDVACDSGGSGEARPPQRPLPGRRVLVVDDFEDNRVLVARLLERAGARVEQAASGESALACVQAAEAVGHAFDVILMDLRMPGMDGFETTRVLRSRGCRSQVVALTADALASTQESCLASGFDAHATKPIHRSRLLDLVQDPASAGASALAVEVASPTEGGAQERPSMWQRLVLRCLVPSLRHDRDALRGASMVLGFAMAPLPAIGLGIWALPRIFAPDTARLITWLMLMIAPMLAGVVLLLRMRGSVVWAGHMLLAYAFLPISALTLLGGGTKSCYGPWLVILPIWANSILGLRAGRAWAGLSVGALCALLGFETYAGDLPNRLLPDATPLAHFIALSSLACTLDLLCLAYENAKRSTLDRMAQLNAELAAARDRAHAAREAKERFLATVSHEMRTPMTSIVGFCELLQDLWTARPPRGCEALPLLERVASNGASLLRILNDVLDLARIEAGKLALERVVASPEALVREAVAAIAEHAGTAQVGIELEIEGALPQAIETDPTRVRLLLIKLLEAAIDAMGKRSIAVRVRSELGPDRPELALSIGASSADGDTSFASACRIFGASSEHLSASLARALCERLGGQLELARAPGADPAIEVRLPVVVVRAPQELPTQGPVSRAVPSIAGLRILLAEDSPDSQRLIVHVLRSAGAHVETANDGQRAVEAVRAVGGERGFDVVLMDMHMPVLDGAQATRLLRAEGYTGAIVALTAQRADEARAECFAVGCDDFASKPIDRSGLVARVAAAVERRRQDASGKESRRQRGG